MDRTGVSIPAQNLGDPGFRLREGPIRRYHEVHQGQNVEFVRIRHRHGGQFRKQSALLRLEYCPSVACHKTHDFRGRALHREERRPVESMQSGCRQLLRVAEVMQPRRCRELRGDPPPSLDESVGQLADRSHMGPSAAEAR